MAGPLALLAPVVAGGTKAAAGKGLLASLKSLLGSTKAGAAAGKFGSRMAGNKFVQNAMAGLPQSKGELMGRALPDLFFGGVAGLMTPGDLGDKLIAGTTATAGGALGSMGVRAGINGLRPGSVIPGSANYKGGLDMMSEIIGGYGGDMAANGVADGIMRVKGGGTTPYEKLAAEQQQALEQDILRRYLSGKGGYPTMNDNTGLY